MIARTKRGSRVTRHKNLDELFLDTQLETMNQSNYDRAAIRPLEVRSITEPLPGTSTSRNVEEDNGPPAQDVGSRPRKRKRRRRNPDKECGPVVTTGDQTQQSNHGIPRPSVRSRFLSHAVNRSRRSKSPPNIHKTFTGAMFTKTFFEDQNDFFTVKKTGYARSGRRTDLKITCANGSFFVHKAVVLGGSNNACRDLLQGHENEDLSEIILADYELGIVKAVFQVFYLGWIPFDPQMNPTQLREICNFCGIKNLEEDQMDEDESKMCLLGFTFPSQPRSNESYRMEFTGEHPGNLEDERSQSQYTSASTSTSTVDPHDTSRETSTDASVLNTIVEGDGGLPTFPVPPRPHRLNALCLSDTNAAHSDVGANNSTQLTQSGLTSSSAVSSASSAPSKNEKTVDKFLNAVLTPIKVRIIRKRLVEDVEKTNYNQEDSNDDTIGIIINRRDSAAPSPCSSTSCYRRHQPSSSSGHRCRTSHMPGENPPRNPKKLRRIPSISSSTSHGIGKTIIPEPDISGEFHNRYPDLEFTALPFGRDDDLPVRNVLELIPDISVQSEVNRDIGKKVILDELNGLFVFPQAFPPGPTEDDENPAVIQYTAAFEPLEPEKSIIPTPPLSSTVQLGHMCGSEVCIDTQTGFFAFPGCARLGEVIEGPDTETLSGVENTDDSTPYHCEPNITPLTNDQSREPSTVLSDAGPVVGSFIEVDGFSEDVAGSQRKLPVHTFNAEVLRADAIEPSTHVSNTAQNWTIPVSNEGNSANFNVVNGMVYENTPRGTSDADIDSGNNIEVARPILDFKPDFPAHDIANEVVSGGPVISSLYCESCMIQFTLWEDFEDHLCF